MPIRQGKQRFKSPNNAKSLEKHGVRPRNAEHSNILSNQCFNLPKYDLMPHLGGVALAGRAEFPVHLGASVSCLQLASVMDWACRSCPCLDS